MWSSGLLRHMNPAEAGGDEPSFADMIETWIDMAALDGSFGWVGIANLPSAAARRACLPDEGFAEVFGGPITASRSAASSSPTARARWSTAASG